MIKNLLKKIFKLRNIFTNKSKYGRNIAECGTVIYRLPYVVEVPEGYELPKFNFKTGHVEYSDGTIAEYIELRKIK